MEDIIVNKYKTLLKKCLEKTISLKLIQQIIYTSQLNNPEKIVDNLLIKIDEMTEQQFKKEVEKMIKEN